jgi:exo-1,4-beta-D-glucosaminidase
VLWSDNWVEIMPGESVTLTGVLPEGAPPAPVIQVTGWNVDAQTITPTIAIARRP